MSCRAFVVSLLLLCIWSVFGPVFLEADAAKGVFVLPCSALRERGGGGYTNSPGIDDMRRAEDGEAGVHKRSGNMWHAPRRQGTPPTRRY